MAKVFVCTGTTSVATSLVPAGQYGVCQNGAGQWEEQSQMTVTDLGTLFIVIAIFYAFLKGFEHGRKERA